MKHFDNVATIAELKNQYKKLAFKNHPDRGGNTETMQQINAEYDALLKSIIAGSAESDYSTEENKTFWESKEEHSEVEKKVKEALDKIRGKEKYDLILLDVIMDPLDGVTVMKKFKDIRNFKTNVILLTRNNEYEYNEEYLKYGFSGYLLKPISKDKLFEIIDKYLK